MKPLSERHRISFCFDDGYAASVMKTAALFEERGLAASFCVVTDPVGSEDSFIRAGAIGDFALFREMAVRGHEVMPHGHRHINLANVTIAQAQDEVSRCLDIFLAEMPGHCESDLIYHCAFNRLPPALEPWLRARVKAVRATTANIGLNALPGIAPPFVFDACFPLPPDDPAVTSTMLDRFLAAPPAWLVLCFHGLDGEGWGPVSSRDLAAWLDRLIAAGVVILPPGAALQEHVPADT